MSLKIREIGAHSLYLKNSYNKYNFIEVILQILD
jgi:hypothetical protein